MKYQLLIAATVFLELLVGCQSHSLPTAPAQQDQMTGTSQSSSDTTQSVTRHIWGYFNCAVDLQSGTISALPSRTADLHINATQPLNTSMGIGIAMLPESTPSTGYIVVNVSIKHPFPGNANLTGFDVHGIFLADGSLDAGGLKIAGLDDTRLLNPDGWSRWWNPAEFSTPGLLGYVPGKFRKYPAGEPPSATINPYKLFGDGLNATASADLFKLSNLTDGNSRAIFRSASTNTRQYKIQFAMKGGPVVKFDYAIDASWAPPTTNPPKTLPADFPINANAPEAFIVSPKIAHCTLAGTPFGGVGSGEVALSVEVWDWQGWSAGSYSDQIGNVKLYSPYVQFNPPTVQQTDQGKSTLLMVTATGIPSTTGIVPVVIEIPSPGTAWKQGSQVAPSGQIAAYARIDINVGLMQCEPDDNVICDDAVAVNLSSTATGSVCMPYDPSDFFTFAVPNGSVKEGTIVLDNYDFADNDLILYKGCPGDIVDSAMTPGVGKETINAANLESGLYYVCVLPGEQAGSDVQPYKLTLDLHKPSSACTSDSNDDYTTAGTIGLQDSIIGSVCSGGDVHDWYKITVPKDKVAGGSMYLHNQSTGDINIRVYDTYPGSITFWGTNPGTQDEMINIPGLGPGDHYIDIFAQGSTPAGDRPYQLDTQLDISGYACSSGSGHESPLTAYPIGLTEVYSGTVCYPVDPDWFYINVPENKAVSGTITLTSNQSADDDLFLYSDPAAAPIQSSEQAGIMDEHITLQELDTGKYYIKASAHPIVGGGDQPYTLTMNLTSKNVGNFDFKIHAHIIEKSDGTGPATTEAKVADDVAWASTFYSKWNGSFTLVSIDYVKNSAWLAASSNEMSQCHQVYGDKSGPINVYYVNSFTDMTDAAAYTIMDCRYAHETHSFTYVVMCDYGQDMVLAHELGHATGIFLDMYLLDQYTCSDLNGYYCPYPPNNSYCNKADAKIGNLMYWQVQGWTQPSNYWLSDKNWQDPVKPIDSQVENWTYFHTNYPNNF